MKVCCAKGAEPYLALKSLSCWFFEEDRVSVASFRYTVCCHLLTDPFRPGCFGCTCVCYARDRQGGREVRVECWKATLACPCVDEGSPTCGQAGTDIAPSDCPVFRHASQNHERSKPQTLLAGCQTPGGSIEGVRTRLLGSF